MSVCNVLESVSSDLDGTHYKHLVTWSATSNAHKELTGANLQYQRHKDTVLFSSCEEGLALADLPEAQD